MVRTQRMVKVGKEKGSVEKVYIKKERRKKKVRKKIKKKKRMLGSGTKTRMT